jgi:2-polyprenyl-6-methoxyphenol hydroxylase-like FAD-dependent oxidoreductase
MRILIVGAGISGITLAALLEQRGVRPVIVERAPNLEHAGYMLERVDALLDALPDDAAEMFFWRLSDVRSTEWVQGRIVLLGDAAAGFLPTAGIGASMAMESAAALNDELSRTDNRFVEHALELYVKRRRQRVERIQSDSRKLSRLMFMSRASVAAIRNFALRFYTLEMLARDIARAFNDPI